MGFRHLYVSLLIAPLLVVAAAGDALAQGREYLCDPANEDCRAILIRYIDNEPSGGAIDVAFWFMEDARYTAALGRARTRGVRVRVLMDTRANATYEHNAARLNELQTAGIPMRRYLTSYILHWKAMLFRGQGVVQFSGANYSADALRYEPSTGPYVNYTDEAIFFTDEAAIVNSFREKFDDFWVDTRNWADYANVTQPLTREEENDRYPVDPRLNFPPEQNYRTRSLARYSASRLSSSGFGVDVIMYRITDQRHTDAMIALEQRGVPVRLITEQAQYRLVSRMWHSWNVDRLYAAGVEVRDRAHAGLNHQKSVILYDQDSAPGDQPLVIFGSSNWTSPSAGGQLEHNMFTPQPTLVNWFIDQFDRKWNNRAPVAETKAFRPLPPDRPTAPSPANMAVNVATTTTLRWNGGPWAHLYDLYLGTSPSNLRLFASHVTDQNLRELPSKTETSSFPEARFSGYALPAGTLQSGTTYYWRVVGKTMALAETPSDIWSFTTEGTAPPPPPPPSGEIVLYASGATAVGGWARESDGTAAGGFKMRHPNNGAAKVASPSASPAHYFELTFTAEAGRPYHLWIRGKADQNYWANDSVYVQFSGSVTSGGSPTWRIGTTSATEVNIEDCSGCGLSNWGWQDNGWGVNVAGPHVYFGTTGTQTIRVQTREDGLAIDQIVLSPATYLTSSPGALRNDITILGESSSGGGGGEEPPPPPPPDEEPVGEPPDNNPDEVVLYAGLSARVAGAWRTESEGTAAGNTVVRHPNAGASKRSAPLANPADYFELTFNAEAGQAYRIWIRGKADNDYWGNDSVFVQFDGAVDAGNSPIWRIGTTSAADINLEECSGCGLSGWGWQDNGWGTGVLGPVVYFATTGPQTVRIQTREDGLSIDQVVLSSSMFLTESPGATTGDTTILAR